MPKIDWSKPTNKIKIDPELFLELQTLDAAYIDDNGFEVCNPKPTHVEVEHRPHSLKEQIQRLIHSEVSLAAMNQGAESFEEADDFDIPDDLPDLRSEYTVMDDEWLEGRQELPFKPPSDDNKAGQSSQAGPAPKEKESGKDPEEKKKE